VQEVRSDEIVAVLGEFVRGKTARPGLQCGGATNNKTSPPMISNSPSRPFSPMLIRNARSSALDDSTAQHCCSAQPDQAQEVHAIQLDGP
jgi:hypothetical protein